jgi:hypothetical protein
MADLDYPFWRGLMVATAAHAGLKYEPHFEPGADAPLGEPGQRFLGRITTWMHAKNVAAVKAGKPQPYKGVKADTKILTLEVRRALLPDRPSWQDELVRIVRQDAKNPAAAYYTQGGQRWQGVDAVYGKIQAHPATWPRLRSGDCSAGVSRWHLGAWQSHLGFIPHDFVNNCRWRAGYTGSIADTCKRVRGAIQIGDMPLYGHGDFHHVEVVIDPANKLCGNHGSQSGPNIVRWDAHETPSIFVRPIYPH